MSAAAPTAPGRAGGGAAALVVGEALVDVVHAGGTTREHPGGSPANVALGLGRLGRPARLLTRLVDDERGRRVLEHLRASGVELAAPLLPAAEGVRTSTAQAHVGADGGARYEFDLEWSLPVDVVDEVLAPLDGRRPLVVATGSLGTALEPGGAQVARLLEALRPTTTVVYDPNLRPTIIGPAEEVRAGVEALVGTADVVKMSAEDAEWLFPDRAPEETARSWLGLGPALVVLTRGGEGSLALCAAGEVDQPGLAVDVADTVGAGDSFTGGLVDALWSADLLGADRREALARVGTEVLTACVAAAAEVAAVTVSRPGADPPTREELGRG
ncbi:carbohydrate kinase [uncultured Pseudokineococcus sp.]|uniref:carbohydrate kinase family protein n=1 Tax=uncultured Pseudokineococcus sp. TaxID=1642928 RepID=UPI00260558DE|nr:carbohydrate kinase [uncultured Pseudokineococcus sp.]